MKAGSSHLNAGRDGPTGRKPGEQHAHLSPSLLSLLWGSPSTKPNGKSEGSTEILGDAPLAVGLQGLKLGRAEWRVDPG